MIDLRKTISVSTLFLGILVLFVFTISSTPDPVSEGSVMESASPSTPVLLGASGGNTSGEEGHGEEKSSGKQGGPWMELLIHFSGIVVLMLIYVLWVHEPVKNALSDRQEKIKSELAGAREDLDEIEQKAGEVEEKLGNVEEEFEEEREELLQKGRHMKEETIEEAEEQAEERMERAKQEVELARKQARIEIEQKLKNNVVEIVHRYFEEQSGEELHKQFMDSFFDSLDAANTISEFRRGTVSSNGKPNQEEQTT